jgi:hypothetical protein
MTEIKPIPVQSDVFNLFSSAILLNLECRVRRSHEMCAIRAPAKGNSIPQSPIEAVLQLVSSALSAAITESLCLPIEWAPSTRGNQCLLFGRLAG